VLSYGIAWWSGQLSFGRTAGHVLVGYAAVIAIMLVSAPTPATARTLYVMFMVGSCLTAARCATRIAFDAAVRPRARVLIVLGALSLGCVMGALADPMIRLASLHRDGQAAVQPPH